MRQGPLDGLRVIDLTDDSGRFATKLLAECGASVMRLGHGASGPPMREHDAQVKGGLLDWWYDGGKCRVDMDLESTTDRLEYRRLAARADLIFDTEAPGRLASLGIDHRDLVEGNRRLVQVSLTPFGSTGPRRGWQTSDLVAAALGGVLSVSGLPEQPVNPWGRQAFNFAGFQVVITGLAAVRAAQQTGAGQHVDMSIHEAVCTSIEQLFFQYWFDDLLPQPKVAPRQGSLHWGKGFVVVPAGDGWEMITAAPNLPGLLKWMADEGSDQAADLIDRPFDQIRPLIMETMTSFVRDRDPTELFLQAQRRRVSFAAVETVAAVAANPQHAFRGFLRPVDWAGSPVVVPGPVARFSASQAPPPTPPGDIVAVDEALARWDEPRPVAAAGSSLRKPLEGVRILDLSHVLAGPMCTRLLGDLGAEVLKLQTAERAANVNEPNYPYFYVWNRSKKAISLNMKDERAIEMIRRLVAKSDVLIENFAAGVVERWGLPYERLEAWNPRLVYVSMSGCGHEGPWSDIVTYAPTIHALAGLTYLCNPPGRGDVGPGYSLSDHAAGLAAAVSTLAALLDREVTGAGQHVDIAQMEIGSYLIGPALVDFLSNGREAHPVGNRDPFGELVPNDCYPTSDGGWLAVSCRDDRDWARLVQACGLTVDPAWGSTAGRLRHIAEIDDLLAGWAASVTADHGQDLLQGAGVPAGKIQDAGDLMTDPQLLARELWHSFDHVNFGRRPYDRYPAIWSDCSLEPYLPSPAYVGEHNFEVYGQLLGMSEDAIAERIGDGLFE